VCLLLRVPGELGGGIGLAVGEAQYGGELGTTDRVVLVDLDVVEVGAGLSNDFLSANVCKHNSFP
jgi:hypothetical protein